jgi:CLIP-associating protein 1/2
VHIRRIHPIFPLRPYLASLVDALEDTDGSVRDCARQSIVELFTGPHVSDAARADLKKEMAKKNVRRTILESVQSQLASSTSGGNRLGGAGSDAGSENGDATFAAPSTKKQYIPPSMMLKRSMTAASGGGTSGGSGISRTFSQSTVTTLAESTSSRPDSRMAGELPPISSDGLEVQPAYVRAATECVHIPVLMRLQIASAKDLENEFQQMLKYFEVSLTTPSVRWWDRV